MVQRWRFDFLIKINSDYFLIDYRINRFSQKKDKKTPQKLAKDFFLIIWKLQHPTSNDTFVMGVWFYLWTECWMDKVKGPQVLFKPAKTEKQRLSGNHLHASQHTHRGDQYIRLPASLPFVIAFYLYLKINLSHISHKRSFRWKSGGSPTRRQQQLFHPVRYFRLQVKPKICSGAKHRAWELDKRRSRADGSPPLASRKDQQRRGRPAPKTPRPRTKKHKFRDSRLQGICQCGKAGHSETL